MAKSKKITSLRGMWGTNMFTVLLIIFAAASVFIYDRTVWIARAQQPATSSPSAILVCSNTTNGNLRAVDSLSKCKNGEKGLALQSAISNLISDVEVVWFTPPGDRNTNYESGIKLECPSGKVAIGGGNTEVVSKNVPFGDAFTGSEGKTTELGKGWEIIPWKYVQAPVIYTICARVNQ